MIEDCQSRRHSVSLCSTNFAGHVFSRRLGQQQRIELQSGGKECMAVEHRTDNVMSGRCIGVPKTGRTFSFCLRHRSQAFGAFVFFIDDESYRLCLCLKWKKMHCTAAGLSREYTPPDKVR